MVRKTVAAVITFTTAALAAASGANAASNHDQNLKEASKPRVEVVCDSSTSMRPFEKQTKKLMEEVNKYFVQHGLKANLYTFGKDIKRLKDVNLYKANELDTNYAKLLERLEKATNTVTVVITDGKVPTSRVKDVQRIEQEGAVLNDSGNVICALTVGKPTPIVKKFAPIAGSYKDYKKVLDDCIKTWEALHSEGKAVAKVATPEPPPQLIKTVNEAGFKILKTQAPVKASAAQVEVIIRTK